MIYRQCKRCCIKKELLNIYFQSSFDKKTNKIYFKNTCRECEKNICKNYHINNKENILLKKKQYYFNNKNKKSKYGIKYSQRPEIKKKNNKRALKRYYENKNNPIFILKRRISSAVSKQLKRMFANKNNQSSLKYLPYNMQILKEHLEKQFNNGMSWNNYGNFWHIDHIIPQSDLPYISMKDDNFKICWSLKNLRPLEAKQNMSDGGTRIRHKKINNK